MRRQEAVGSSEAAEAAADAFLNVCERRGMTEEENLIWNAMAFICDEQFQNRHSPFYEAIQPLLAEARNRRAGLVSVAPCLSHFSTEYLHMELVFDALMDPTKGGFRWLA